MEKEPLGKKRLFFDGRELQKRGKKKILVFARRGRGEDETKKNGKFSSDSISISEECGGNMLKNGKE